MPLIRYEIGDYATVVEGQCPCGRTLPLIGQVAGRSLNLFRWTEGRLLSPWPLVEPLKAERRFKQFQIVQKAIDLYCVRFVADCQLDREGEIEIEAAFCRILGAPVTVEFQQLAQIPRTAGGKFMIALSELATRC